MKNTWTVRSATMEDAIAVERFLVSVPEFSETLLAGEQREVWKWLYSRHSNVIENVMIAHDEDNKIIAHYGLSRLPYLLNGQPVDAGMACLLGIAEGYRKSSVFLEVTTRLLKLLRSGEWTFATGLANRTGLLEFHKAFGFRDVGEVPIFAKPLRLGKIAQKVLPTLAYPILLPVVWPAEKLLRFLLRCHGMQSSGAIRLEEIKTFDDAIAATSSEISRHHRYYAERTAVLLNARFFGVAGREYTVLRIVDHERPLGYVVLRLMDMKGFRAVGIVDICFDFLRRDVARAVIAAVDRFAIGKNADLISVLTNSKPLIGALRSGFFLRAPDHFKLVVMEPAKKFGLGASRIDDWFVTWFEHDYV